MCLKKEKVSVVIPLYNEENNIAPLYEKIKNVFADLVQKYEILFVDDGSEDRTYDILKYIQAEDSHIRVVKLDKNYGQQYALLKGFEYTNGEIVVIMDGDLQNDPRDIPKFLEKIEEGYDLVNGWRYPRRDPLRRRLISAIANWIIKKKTGIALHDYGCAFIAVKKNLVNKLRAYKLKARFIKPLLVMLADSPVEIKINHNRRRSGISKYHFVKVINSGLDFIFNFKV